jgi:hypothetical protein
LLKVVRILPNSALVAVLIALFCLSGSRPAPAQEHIDFGGTQSFGFTTSYSPDSSHILIGESEGRRTWTVGFEYARLLRQGRHFRLDYEGSVLPFYEEFDPAVIGLTYSILGVTSTVPENPPVRVTTINRGPIGSIGEPHGQSAPIYAIYGNMNTYGGALAPLGARATLFQHHSIQPSFSVDLGFVVATRDIPIDSSDQFNYMFSFGPGVQIFSTPEASIRIEYIYRHISNAGQGNVNPGVDMGTFRLTFLRSR